MNHPRQLGRYRVERELGKGAMGRVYLAHDPAINRRLALKTVSLPEGLSRREHDEIQARFRREVQAAGRLAHPSIVTIYDIGEEPDVGTFVAMEYVEGEPLESFVDAGSLLDPRAVASIGCQAADALAYAHRNGVVHRDIKPANLILVDRRLVKIADFGLAKHIGSSLTTAGELLGTPNYMSPEQIRGIEVDGRSDLFSLAIVVYELLTGKRPFRGESISTVIYRITNEPPIEPDLSRIPGSAPIKTFLGRGLAKNPDDRFQTGDEFARHLREAVTSAGRSTAPSAATPVSTGTGTTAGAEVEPASSAAAGVTPATSGATRGASSARDDRARTHGGDAPGSARTRSEVQGAAGPESRTPPRTGRPPAARREQTTARRGRPGSARRKPRSRKSVSMTPVLMVIALGLAGGFVYRQEIANLIWPPSQAPTATLDTPVAAEPLVTLPSREASEGAPRPPAGAPGAADRPVDAVKATPGAAQPPVKVDAGERPAAEQLSSTAAQPEPVSPAPKTPSPPPVETLATLRSVPAGATFYVDGRPLPPGSDRVPLSDADAELPVRAVLGCLEAARTVTRADAGAEVVMDLKPAVVSVVIATEPEDARIRVDGRLVDGSPARARLDACEPHEVVVQREGYQDWSRTLQLTADGRLEAPDRLEARLEPIPMGRLVIPDAPFPVQILLGGHQPVRPGTLDLVAGSYRVVFSADEIMFRQEVRVRVPADGRAELGIRFPPVVELTVLAQPSNATITLVKDGLTRDLGFAPIIDQRIVTGAYKIKCVFNHNGEEQEKRIEVAEGDSPRVRFVAGRP